MKSGSSPRPLHLRSQMVTVSYGTVASAEERAPKQNINKQVRLDVERVDCGCFSALVRLQGRRGRQESPRWKELGPTNKLFENRTDDALEATFAFGPLSVLQIGSV